MDMLKYLQLTFEGYSEDYEFIKQDNKNKNYYMVDANVLNLVLKPWENTHLIHITQNEEIKKYIAYFLAVNFTQYIKDNPDYVSILPYHADEIKKLGLDEYLHNYSESNIDINKIVKKIESQSNDLEKIRVIAEQIPKLYDALIHKNRYSFKVNQLKIINKLRHLREIAPNRDYNQPFEEILEYLKEQESEKIESRHTDEALQKDAKAMSLLKYINKHNKNSRYILITADNNLLNLTIDTKYEDDYSQYIRKIDTIAPFLANNRLTNSETGIKKVSVFLSKIVSNKNQIRNLNDNFEASILKKFVDIIDYVGIKTYVKATEQVSIDEVMKIINSDDIKKELEQRIKDIKNEFVDALAWTPEALQWIQTVEEGTANRDDPSVRLPLPYTCTDKNNQTILDSLYNVLYKRKKITRSIISKIFNANSKIIKVATMIVQIANEDFKKAINVLDELKSDNQIDKNELELFEAYAKRHELKDTGNFNELYQQVKNLSSTSKQKLEAIAIRVLSAYNELLCHKNEAKYTNNNSLENDIYQALKTLQSDDEENDFGTQELCNRIVLNAISYLMYLRIKNNSFEITKNKIYQLLLLKSNFLSNLKNQTDTNYYRSLMLLYWQWEQDKNGKKDDLLNLINRIIEQNKGNFSHSYKYERLKKLKSIVKTTLFN